MNIFSIFSIFVSFYLLIYEKSQIYDVIMYYKYNCSFLISFFKL